MKNKKLVLSFYNVYENDSLKNYLEDMALKGWELTGFGNFFLHFKACRPHPVRYCVEVMKDSSPYASNQARPLKQYREFCQEAGWDYRGTNGYLHVFCTDDMEAVPVETDSQERYQNICRAASGSCATVGILFLVLCLMNLYTCYRQKTLLSSNGAVVLLLLASAAWTAVDFLLWRRKARRSLQDTGTLPCAPWRSVRLKNFAGACLALMFCGTVFSATFARVSRDTRIFILPYLITYALMLFVFSWLIRLLRERTHFRKTTNIAIYWGAAMVMAILVTAGFCALIFTHFLR